MIFSLPLNQFTKEHIGTLYESISKQYPFLDEKLVNKICIEFLLESESLKSKVSEIPLTITCADLEALVVDLFILRSTSGAEFSENDQNNSDLRLFRLYDNLSWKKIYSKPIFSNVDEKEIKTNIWLSFLNKLKSRSPLRVFSITEKQLSLKHDLFLDFMRGQMIVHSLKTINQQENPHELLKYHRYFEKTFKRAYKWSLGKNIDNDELQDIVSDKIVEFLTEINKPDFKLTSTLNTYFFGFISTGLKTFFRKKAKLPFFIDIDEIDEETEYSHFSEEEVEFIKTIDRNEVYTQIVLIQCRQSEKKTQDIMVMDGMEIPHKVIGKVVKESESYVSTKIYRFNQKVRKIVSNLYNEPRT